MKQYLLFSWVINHPANRLKPSLQGINQSYREALRNRFRIDKGLFYVLLVLMSNSLLAQNYALEFDGVDDHISVSTLGTSSSFTVEMWVYHPNLESGFVTLLDFNNDQPWLGFFDGEFALWSSSPYTAGSLIKSSGWVHVAATYDGTDLKLYVDGEEEYTGTVSVVTGQTGMTIGFSVADEYFTGRMDELRIWSDARTQEEIRSNRFEKLTGSESNLEAYYNFDEGTGTTLNDLTSNNHDGTLNNFASTAWVQGAPAGLNTWDGSIWSDGTPTASSDIAFLEDYDFSSGGLSVNSVYIIDTASVNVETTYLEVKGEIQNDGSLTVESGASLLTYADTLFMGSKPLFRRSTTFSTSEGQYSIVGSPVKEENAAALGSIVYGYDETIEYNSSIDNPGSGNDGLDRYNLISSSDALEPGVGYFSAFTGDISFQGIPNSGDIIVDLTHTNHDPTGLKDENNYEGFNLVANPYPSAIKLTSLLNGNASDIAGAIYLWDDGGSTTRRTNADYIVANAMGATGGSGRASDWDGYIRSMQGFFVKGNATGVISLRFADSMRVSGDNTDDAYFRTAANYPLLRLSLNGPSDQSETLLGLAADATIHHDSKYDAFKPAKSGVSIYSLIDDQPQAIQGLPLHFEGSIALGMAIPESGMYQISMSQFEWPQNLILYDRLLDQRISLTNGHYAFHCNAGKINDRFTLLVSKIITETPGEQDKTSWFHRGVLYINNTQNSPIEMNILSIDGKVIHSQQIAPGHHEINTSLDGLHLCVLKSNGQIISTLKFAVQQ